MSKKTSKQKCGSLSYECQKCGHVTEFSLQAKDLTTNNEFGVVPKVKLEKEVKLESKIKLEPKKEIVGAVPPMLIEINHRGFWITGDDGNHVSTLDEKCNRNSIMLSPECKLYVLKLAFRHYLLTKGVLTPQQIDPANLVPHIKVRNDPKDPFSKYKIMDGKMFMIEEKDISAKNDFITIELNRDLDLHFTLVYSKGIKKRTELLEDLSQVLNHLVAKPELIAQYSSLPYFGKDAIQYWVETRHSYPNNVVPPPDYKPAPQLSDKELFGKYKVSPAGTIIGEL